MMAACEPETVASPLVSRIRAGRGYGLAGLLVALAGCTRLLGPSAPAPEVDLSEPGWQIWTGQAAWTPGSDKPPLAGDLLVAAHVDGDLFVSFSKAALPLFTARANDQGWWIDFVERDRSYSGAGEPTKRFIWFRLPEILQGASDIPGWSVNRPAADEIDLMNPRSGERVKMLIDS